MSFDPDNDQNGRETTMNDAVDAWAKLRAALPEGARLGVEDIVAELAAARERKRDCAALLARAEAAEKLLREAVEIINGFLGYGSDPNYPWERARTFVESIATFPPSAGERT